MKPAAIVLALLGCAADAGEQTTSYLHQIRAELTLAARVEIQASPENGGGRNSVVDGATIRDMAKAMPRQSSVREMEGAISSASYVELEIYGAADAKKPTHRLTVTPTLCMFEKDGRVYEFATKDDALYSLVLKASRAGR